MKKWGRMEWIRFVEEAEDNLMYSEEEIKCLLDFYYETRKKSEGVSK